MKKITLLLLLALAVILQPSAQAETKTLRWAAATDSNAPYAFYGPGNKLTGFEYEVIQAIAREMGREPVFVPNDWDGLIPGLGRGLYDCVICGIEITPDKAQEVLFTNPYYVSYEQFVVRKGTKPVTSLEELKGKQVGTLSQTASFNMLSKTPGVIVKTYDEEINAYADVVNGRLFGVLLDYPIAKYYAFANPNLEFTGPPFGQITYGIAFSKANAALVAEMNEALARVIASGEMRDILSRWGLWTAMVADTFGQPEEPSLPDTEYRSFVAATAEQPSLVNRIIGYTRFWPLLLEASLLTIEVSLLGMVGAVLLGFTLAIMRVYGPFPIRWLATLYIELIRGTPLLIQLLILFYGLPNIGIKLEPFVAGVLGLALNYAAYEAENYRAGLLAIPKGQMEAARALGMTQRQGLFHVVIPQSFRLVLPPVTNDFISLLKDSSLVSMVTLVDLTGAYKQIATQTFDYFGAGLLVAAFYLLIGLPFVRLARYTEQRLNPGAHSTSTKGARFHLPFGKS
jgi:polar amino acid transport system substrate-binding protein